MENLVKSNSVFWRYRFSNKQLQ